MQDVTLRVDPDAVTLPVETTEPVFRITGRSPLAGHVQVSGSKNSALALMAGALLLPEACRIQNVPRLVDIRRMGEILRSLGVTVRHEGSHLEIDARDLSSRPAPYELVSKLRASFFVIGPMLARLGEAKVPLPGGCAIGARPVDLHVRGLQAMGATVHIEHGVVHAQARKLTGARIYMDYPSVGATETLIMAAVLAEGETVLENAAQEPEVVDLADFCRSMGARIRGDGTNTIVIEGIQRPHGTDYHVIPDRIEASTFLLAGAITRSTLVVGPVVPDHLSPVIAKLRAMGLRIREAGSRHLEIAPADLESGWLCRGTDIETLPHPGFPTDVQAPIMALASLAEGDSAIEETVFENRMNHVPELCRMGADIRIKNGVAIIRGVPSFSGAPVQATDLRAGAALVLAGLAAQGVTHVRGLRHIDRGYEGLDEKLRGVGAQIERSTMPILVEGSPVAPILS